MKGKPTSELHELKTAPPAAEWHGRAGFTLMELLLVIAIVAVLATVVILALNPAELLRQSRDAVRLSDMTNMRKALALYVTDSGGTFPALSSSTVYLSLIDPLATTTLGTDCTGVGLLPPSGLSYHCSASSSVKRVDGTGWMPLNFQSVSAGSPLSALPTDPVNSSSSAFYYQLMMSPSGDYTLSSLMESAKYQVTAQKDGGTDPSRYEIGTSLALASKAAGLVGYWPFEEGGGTTAIDASGNGNNGTWSGTPIGTSGYYSVGKVGGFAGTFASSSNDYVLLGTSLNLNPPIFTVAAWADPTAANLTYGFIYSSAPDCCGTGNGINLLTSYATGLPQVQVWNTSVNKAQAVTASVANTWEYLVGTYDGTSVKLYINGALDKVTAYAGGVGTPASGAVTLGRLFYYTQGGFNGLIDDVRLYSRPFSAVEIQALYNSEK